MPLQQDIVVYIHEHVLIDCTITTDPDITTTKDADVGATSISIKPLGKAMVSTDKIYFDTGVIVTLSANAAIGATSISVNATTGKVTSGDKGGKIQNITGWNFISTFTRNITDAADIFAKTSASGIAITTAADGLLRITLDQDDTALLIPEGLFHWDLWRTDANQEAPLIVGQVKAVRTPSRPAPT